MAVSKTLQEDTNTSAPSEETLRVLLERGGKDHFNLEGAKGAGLSFRPSRFTPDQLNVQSATARYVDLDGNLATSRLLNVSSSGVAFELPNGEVLRNGQVIETFTASFDDIVIYSGRANVINQRDLDGVTVVGVAFTDEYLVPDKLDSASKLAASTREIDVTLSNLDQLISGTIDDSVKVLTADFRLFLNGLKELFDSAVPANASHEFEDGFVKAVEKQAAPVFHKFIHRMNEMNKGIPEDQRSSITGYMKQHIEELLLPAPIYRQSYYKPLGYAGDFVTMNIAYTNHYQGETAYGKFLNRMFCELMISRAAISRVTFLRDWIEKAVSENNDRAIRIMSIASGPAREVQDYLTVGTPKNQIEFFLFDQDPQALAFAQSNLSPVARRFGDQVAIRYINGAVKHLVREPHRFESLGNQDLIYTAGLFDYLRKAPAAKLLENLFNLLAPGGRLIIGNLSPECDSQGFLENLVDWEIIYRDDNEMLELTSLVSPSDTELDFEATKVNRFLVVKR